METAIFHNCKEAGLAPGPSEVAGAPRQLIYFVDDLNMPALDKYNTQPGAPALMI